MKLHRVFALVLRHLYLYKRSLARFMEVFYFPLLDILLWGFLTIYLQRFPAPFQGLCRSSSGPSSSGTSSTVPSRGSPFRSSKRCGRGTS